LRKNPDPMPTLDEHAAILSPASPLSSPTLRRLGAVVRLLVVVGAVALACVPFWLWTSREWVEADVHSMIGMEHSPLTVDERALWFNALAGLPALALGFFLLWQLWQLFGEYGRGLVFSRRAVRHLRRFASGVMALGLLSPLTRTLSVLALSWGNAPGQRQLVLSLSSDDYLRILLGAVMLAIAVVMAEAARVAEENAAFV
jgi:hypothetical protein